jgi:lipoprotein-releasing system ATP-binding protein
MSMIRTKGLTKTFPAPAGDLLVLRGIDMHIRPGEFVSVMGASGAGKSTLLHILGTLDMPTSGDIVIGGRNVMSMPEPELTSFRNSTVGFVFQFHHLLPEFTALENTMMPALINGIARKKASEKASSLLGELGLSGRLEHRPGELSGGEQQRVAVARALVMGPKVVLADEPTGNLDTSTGNELFGLLRKLNKQQGATVLIVTHNEALSAQCDRVLVMTDGTISDNSRYS